ncbi:Hint domain-containing protein [Antarctobacter heliothermus]|uniref:Lamin Tail Domain n=1 Tax=Antarctobacter heliothermus TaxID=74033 RepID=A0A239GHN1_9RHOB|nr:Hint domain-containing protein [Antarctobacter heliothermus]SNS68649.1 Lamin Tail Domain [Antarctobacter heliothermus]
MAATTSEIDGIVINEVSLNTGAFDTNNDGATTGDSDDEFIELHNTSGSPVDISGWSLWDENALNHLFPAGTIIPAGGYLTVIGGTAGDTPLFSSYQFSSTSTVYYGSSDFVQLYNPTSGEFIRLQVNNDFSTPVTPSGGAAAVQVGTTESAVHDPFASTSAQRSPDGDETWVEGAPTPSATNCFAAGTLIATDTGEVPVESLHIGDEVLTADGRRVPVKWLARQSLPRQVMRLASHLVRIRAGALGDGLPYSDLTVTADHGMILDGHVINASALVNGSTIDWVPMRELPDTFTVYHVETEHHDVILANGAPAETFIDYRDRRAFDNYQPAIFTGGPCAV